MSSFNTIGMCFENYNPFGKRKVKTKGEWHSVSLVFLRQTVCLNFAIKK